VVDAAGAGPVVPGPATAGIRRVSDGFRAFAERNAAIRASMRTPADFERVARELCEDQAADGVRYVEVTFTAASHGERPRRPRRCRSRRCWPGCPPAARRPGSSGASILDHSRRQSAARAWRTLELARAHAADGVVAIGVAGDEAYPLRRSPPSSTPRGRPASTSSTTPGETGGPASVREALDAGHAERLGHGIRVLDDAALVDGAAGPRRPAGGVPVVERGARAGGVVRARTRCRRCGRPGSPSR
jgi:adenosine deaminase